jgi:hypothetical protein
MMRPEALLILLALLILPPQAGAVTAAEFVGSSACAGCHRDQYDAWSQSAHGRAGGIPGPDTVISRFNGTVLRFRDATVRLQVDAGGSYLFHVAEDGREALTLKVSAVVGGGLMHGGGTQASFALADDGSWRLIPFDYSRHADTWFCSTHQRGWVPITPELSIRDCQDWPMGWTKGYMGIGCQNCHGSQIALEYLPASHSYRTTQLGFDINCESCHGPGRRHVELAARPDFASLEDIGMSSLAVLDEDGSLEVCFQCHAKKIVLDSTYLPGEPFQDHFALSAAGLDDALLPDGRSARFAYQKNHAYSDCYLNGTMTCVDCHAPHSLHYRDLNGRPLQGRFDDGQCTGCHAAKAQSPGRHSHHPQQVGCVACHMPYLQQQSFGQVIPYGRSDHSIAIPRPELDSRLGLQGACQQCHEDMGDAQLQAATDRWWGEPKPVKPVIQALLNGRWIGETELLGVLADSDGSHPLAEVKLLGVWLQRFAAPGSLRPEMEGLLRRLGAVAPLDRRASALALLDATAGEDEDVRVFLEAQLVAAGSEDAGLRRRWAGLLGMIGSRWLQPHGLDRGLRLYRRALELTPESSGLEARLGRLLLEAAADPRAAMAHLQRALELGPGNAFKHAMVLYDLGRARMALGQSSRALEDLHLAAAILPPESPELATVCQRLRGWIASPEADLPPACG